MLFSLCGWIDALIAWKAGGSSAVCQRGLLNYDIWGKRVGKAPRGWRYTDVKPGCQGSRAPPTFQQRGPRLFRLTVMQEIVPVNLPTRESEHPVLVYFSPPLELVLLLSVVVCSGAVTPLSSLWCLVYNSRFSAQGWRTETRDCDNLGCLEGSLVRPMRRSVALDRFLGSCVTRVVPPWSSVCVCPSIL